MFDVVRKDLGSLLLQQKASRPFPGDVFAIKQRRYRCFAEAADGSWQLCAATPQVEFDSGMLFVGGVQIAKPRFSRDQVSWCQHARLGGATHYTMGHLFIASHGLTAHGRISVGTCAGDARHYDVLATTTTQARYQTQISAEQWPLAPVGLQASATTWIAGPVLELDYAPAIGGSSLPVPIVKLADNDVSDFASWAVDGNLTRLIINIPPAGFACPPGVYQQATIAFDATSNCAYGEGRVMQTDVATAKPGSAWLWKAEVIAAQHPILTTQGTRTMVTAAQLVTADAALSVSELMTILPDDVVNDDANSMLMRNMKWAMGQSSQQRDWLAKFFGEQPPVISEADQQALVRQSLSWYQDKFAMAYLTQSLNSYTGPNAPDHRLSGDQAARLQQFLKSGLAQDKDFSVQHQGIFVDAYLGTKPRLSDYLGDSAPEVVDRASGQVVFTRQDATAEVKVPQGTEVRTASGVGFLTLEDATLAAGQASSGLVAVQAVLPGPQGLVAAGTLVVLPGSLPGVQSVTNPAATTAPADIGGLKWAKTLYFLLTTGPQFTLMVNRIAGAAGDPKALGPANNFACLLTALDRSGLIARDYMQAVLTGVVLRLVPQVVHRDSDTIMQWLPDTLLEMLRKLANGELPDEVEISEQEAEELYQVVLKNKADICMALADFLQSISASDLVGQMRKAEQGFETDPKVGAFIKKWPGLAKLGRCLLVLGWLGAVSCVVVALVKGDWSQMTEIEKAEFVTNIVQLGVIAFDAVPLLWQGVKWLTLGLWGVLQKMWNGLRSLFGLGIQQKVLAGGKNATELEAIELDNLARDAEQAGSDLATAARATGWARLFEEGVLVGSLKILGAAAALAMAGYSMWQLIEDVTHNGSVTTVTFDSVILAANLLSSICLVVDLFVATSVLPIAGALLALAGIILGILASIYEKPDNPVDDWMKDQGIPFAAGLPAVAS